MSNQTLTDWKVTVATAITQSLPLQTIDTAYTLAENYLSSIGGWIPDSNQSPTGPGVPANGKTAEEAATEIISNEYQRVYSLLGNVSINVSFAFDALLQKGMNTTDVIENLNTILQNWITTQLADANLNISTIGTISGTASVVGITTPAMRVSFNNALTGKLYDPKVIGLNFARNNYGLDNTWNISNIYADPNNLVIIIFKYTNTQYITIDSSGNYKYLIKVNRNTYDIMTGTKLKLN